MMIEHVSHRPSVAVIGAGAVGGIVAAHLARAGNNVEIVAKHRDWADIISSRGIHVTGVNGEFTAAMPAVGSVSELSGKKDIVFHATKATDMIDAARKLLPFLHENSRVVSMQNGLCEETLSGIVSPARVVGCIVGWGATMNEPAHIEMTSKGEFVIGTIGNRPDETLSVIAGLLTQVVPVEISSNIMGSLYSKLIINSCITSLGAASGLLLGEMLSKHRIRRIFIEIMREAMAVADAMKLSVEPYAGKLDYYRFLSRGSTFSELKRHLTVGIIGFKYRHLKSSSLQSLERGKATEIDFLNGYISSRGRILDVPTPVNDKIIDIIKEIEEGTRPISPSNLDDVLS